MGWFLPDLFILIIWWPTVYFSYNLNASIYSVLFYPTLSLKLLQSQTLKHMAPGLPYKIRTRCRAENLHTCTYLKTSFCQSTNGRRRSSHWCTYRKRIFWCCKPSWSCEWHPLQETHTSTGAHTHTGGIDLAAFPHAPPWNLHARELSSDVRVTLSFHSGNLK